MSYTDKPIGFLLHLRCVESDLSGRVKILKGEVIIVVVDGTESSVSKYSVRLQVEGEGVGSGY